MSTSSSPSPAARSALPSLLVVKRKLAKPFEKLSRGAQRKAIAQDVLDQLRARAYEANCGDWATYYAAPTPSCTTSEIDDKIGSNQMTVKQLLAAAPIEAEASCSVCALGGLLMSQFRLNGDCKVNTVDAWLSPVRKSVQLCPVTGEFDAGVSAFSPFIRRYFAPTQLQLIEMAFERGEGAFCCKSEVEDWLLSCEEYPEDVRRNADEYSFLGYLPTIQQAAAAIRFGERYEDDDKRLTAIMRKLIAHPKGLFVPPAI